MSWDSFRQGESSVLGLLLMAMNTAYEPYQMCDPRVEKSFWKTWEDFELKHGNEDTYREMLRIKRSVGASYNTSTVKDTPQLF